MIELKAEIFSVLFEKQIFSLSCSAVNTSGKHTILSCINLKFKQHFQYVEVENTICMFVV